MDSDGTVLNVSGSKQIKIASIVAITAKIVKGTNQVTLPIAITNGASIAPNLEHITAVPTPVFLITVGNSSPVNKYNAGTDI